MSSDLKRRVGEILTAQRVPNLALHGLLVVRFDPRMARCGQRLVTAFEAIETALGALPQWAFGFWPKPGGGQTRIAQPKDISKSTDWVHASLRAMKPKVGMTVVMHDGPRPWSSNDGYLHDGQFTLVPQRFGVHLDVCLDKWQPGATLAVILPVDELSEPWPRALGDTLVKTLSAQSAWLTPGLWGVPRSLQHSGFNELTPAVHEKLAAQFPQLDIPLLYFGNSEVRPSRLTPPNAFVGPHWVTWFEGVRHVVEKNPPLELNESRYRLYRAFAKKLAAAGRLATSADRGVTERLLLERFRATTFEASVAQALAVRGEEEARRRNEMKRLEEISTLTHSDARKALALAEPLLVDPVDRHRVIQAGVHAARAIAQAGDLLRVEANRWLERADTVGSLGIRLELDSLAIAFHLGDVALISKYAKAAVASAAGYVPYRDDLKRDATAQRVRRDPRFKKLFA